jgi:hypothetical protein
MREDAGASWACRFSVTAARRSETRMIPSTRWLVGHRPAAASLALLVASAAPSVQAATIHVPGDQPTIQAAIIAAVDHDTILVSPGVYHEAIDFLDKTLEVVSVGGAALTTVDASGLRSSAVTIRNGSPLNSRLQGFTITGGFGTVLGGGKLQTSGGGGILVAGAPSGAPSTALIRGCVITGNDAGSGFYALGGGVYVEATSSATLIGCDISHNVAYAGGGAYGGPGSPSAMTLQGCSVTANRATYAGGVEGGTVRQSVITHNIAAGTGGGMSQVAVAVSCVVMGNRGGVDGGGAYQVGDLISCTFAGNVHTGVVGADSAHDCIFENNLGGGAAEVAIVEGCVFLGNSGVGCFSATGDVSRCTFIGNSDRGLSISASGPVTVSNCFFAHNEAAFGDGLWIAATPPPSGPHHVDFCSFLGDSLACHQPLELAHCILRDLPAPLSSFSVSWSDIEGGFTGIGNFDADPLFVDSAAGDLHLQPGSPCIDAGDPGFVPDPDAVDIDGDPRLVGPAVDVGADEFVP